MRITQHDTYLERNIINNLVNCQDSVANAKTRLSLTIRYMNKAIPFVNRVLFYAKNSAKSDANGK